MSEVQHRPPPRGRGASRGGRGGPRGGFRASTRINGESQSAPSLEEQGELGQLKKQYADKLNTLRELFSEWTDDDLVFALQENAGDMEATITRISGGWFSIQSLRWLIFACYMRVLLTLLPSQD